MWRLILRSKKTNALQMAVLVSGVLFILIGAAFLFFPMAVLQFFAENVAENWLDLVRDNELVAPLFFMVRAYSALLITSGFLMIMPLFDPLKYRGIIYFNGAIFPSVSAFILIANSFVKSNNILTGDTIQQNGSEYFIHRVMLICGIIFALIAVACIFTLILTAKEAREGKE